MKSKLEVLDSGIKIDSTTVKENGRVLMQTIKQVERIL